MIIPVQCCRRSVLAHIDRNGWRLLDKWQLIHNMGSDRNEVWCYLVFSGANDAKSIVPIGGGVYAVYVVYAIYTVYGAQ